MKKPKTSQLLVIGLLLALVVVIPTAQAAPQGPSPIAEIENVGTGLIFYPLVEFKELILTVTGPCGYDFRQVVDRGEPFFKLDETTIDGPYTFNLVRIEQVDSQVLSILKTARKNFDDEAAKSLCREGRLPAPALVQSAGFRVQEGKVIFDPSVVDDRFGFDPLKRFDDPSAAAAAFDKAADQDFGGVPTKDFVINDDLIVDGSACIGFDCVNGEVFGFDTIRLKENNLRIKFDDTSVAASFPRNDWQLTANESANGGASKFSIEDISGGRTPFTVEANARSHSLYVDDGGRIGNRTSTPSVEIHTIDGDTPTLRLQQDGSSGFQPQTWDVAGNETNFFIRDVTNGSALPFRIRPGAPSSSIFIDVDGDVGVGTSSPDASLHVRGTDGTTTAEVEEASTTTDNARILLTLTNNGESTVRLANTNRSEIWDFKHNAGGGFVINEVTQAGAEFVLVNTGDLTILGSLTENSDRNMKENFAEVEGREVLDALAGVPITRWNYKDNDPSIQHIGPMAQDFYAAFGLNGTETGIAGLDTAGVALAAIQELDRTVLAKDEEIDALETRNAELEARLARLETLVDGLTGN